MSRLLPLVRIVLLACCLAASAAAALPLDGLLQQLDPPSEPPTTPREVPSRPPDQDPQPRPSPREAVPDRSGPDELAVRTDASEPPLILVVGALALLAAVIALLVTVARSPGRSIKAP